MTTTATSELLTVEQAAEMLGKPVGTLRNWRYRGEGPISFKIGNSVRYRRDELERWLRAQEDLTGRGDAAR